MTHIPDKEQQVVQVHAQLIHGVVGACTNEQWRQSLEPALQKAEEQGWTTLVSRIRRILAGERDDALLNGLDEEDTAIVRAILRGLQDPDTLPSPDAQPDPNLAAPGLAQLVRDARRGNTDALQWLGTMADQMNQAGGDMARLGAILRKMIDGERDPEKLTKGMSGDLEKFVNSILEELATLEEH